MNCKNEKCNRKLEDLVKKVDQNITDNFLDILNFKVDENHKICNKDNYRKK